MKTSSKFNFLLNSLLLLCGIGILMALGCDPKAQAPQPGLSTACPAIDSTTIEKDTTIFGQNISLTYTWQVPNNVNSFNIWFKKVQLSGQEELLAQTTATTGSYTTPLVPRGQRYRFEIQSVCGEKVSGIVIEDIVRK